MKKLILTIAIILIVACSKEEDKKTMPENRTLFEISAISGGNIFLVCDEPMAIVRYHTGANALPVVGDTIFVHPEADFKLNTNNLYTKMEGNQLFKSDENGVVTEVIDCN